VVGDIRDTRYAIRDTRYAIRDTRYADTLKGPNTQYAYAIRDTQTPSKAPIRNTHTRYAIRRHPQSPQRTSVRIRNTQYAIRKHPQSPLGPLCTSVRIRNTQYAIRKHPQSPLPMSVWIRNTQYAIRKHPQSPLRMSVWQYANGSTGNTLRKHLSDVLTITPALDHTHSLDTPGGHSHTRQPHVSHRLTAQAGAGPTSETCGIQRSASGHTDAHGTRMRSLHTRSRTRSLDQWTIDTACARSRV
jgi:Fe2+ transport system protein FeoA